MSKTPKFDKASHLKQIVWMGERGTQIIAEQESDSGAANEIACRHSDARTMAGSRMRGV
jgi:hypothetical protein